jgi:hypothetical protein
VREESEARDNKWRLTVKTLESETTDLKFLTGKLRGDLLKAEQANMELKARLESALSGLYLPSA